MVGGNLGELCPTAVRRVRLGSVEVAYFTKVFVSEVLKVQSGFFPWLLRIKFKKR